MSETVRQWLGSLSIGDAPGHMVMIGCGSPATLMAAAGNRFKRITVLEPDPEVCARLEASAGDDTRIEIRQAAIGSEVGATSFIVRSWRAFSSHRPPGPAMALFPGLRDEREITVETTTLKAVMESLSIDAGEHNVLRTCLAAAGPVAGALTALEETQPFQDIIMEAGREPAFKGDEPAGAVIEALAACGLSAKVRADTDPDFPEYWISTDNNNSEQIQALEAELKDAREVSEARIKALTEERDALSKTLESADSVREQREARIKALTEERDDLRRRTQEQVDEARSASDVAVRIQALRDADLRDLQERYANVVEERDAQSALLKALTARLTEAEGYLNQISHDQDAGEDSQALPEAGPATATEGKTRKSAKPAASKKTKSAGGKKRNAKRS